MHEHALGRTRADFATETEWAEWVRDYYRYVETYDWVDVADHWRGLEAIFHRNRRWAVRRLLKRWHARTPMLDAGCGTGLNLASMPAGAVGLDINPRNLAVVRGRLSDHPVVEGDIERMPFEDGSFSTVLCAEVLEHIPHPQAALSEIRRVLRPNGVLIGSVPARSLIWRLRFLSSTCPHSEPFHNEYRPDEVRELLAGFVVERVWYSLLRFNVMFVARAPGPEAGAQTR
jgi:ubiquinone/menaquinone biosynthesis C-methylase UbiE